jgi:hypothetical protein
MVYNGVSIERYFSSAVSLRPFQCVKVLAAGLALVGLVPLLLGTCFQLVVIAPMRVSRLQSPLFFPWQASIRSASFFFPTNSGVSGLGDGRSAL